MDEKTLITLEYPKILDQLTGYAAFSASAELALALHPTNNLENARGAQKATSEARFLLSLYSDFSIGGARDIRPLAKQANRGGVLTPSELQDVRNTLTSGRELARVFERRFDQFPILAEISSRLNPPAGIIDAISKVISDQAKVLDNASSKLASLRREIKIAHERIMTRLERYLRDSKTTSMLQEAI
ncbi:MAG: hypothetical protein MUO76_07825, partial [Anaerolineaceae bacterium]|nr:hypothetical protein [Anaerolineaceae bacterium]